MPRSIEKGEPAKLNYNELRYAHINSKAGESQILTSDPWAFVQRALNEKLAKSRGRNRENFQRAVYFADLAEDFYTAASRAELANQRYACILLHAESCKGIPGCEGCRT